jgi:hypothetical protein
VSGLETGLILCCFSPIISVFSSPLAPTFLLFNADLFAGNGSAFHCCYLALGGKEKATEVSASRLHGTLLNV